MSANPYLRLDLQHQQEQNEATEWQDWKDERLTYWRERYLEDGDLADALAIDGGVDRGREIYKAFQYGETVKGIKLIGDAMEIAAQEYAASKVAHEERFAEIARREGVALIRANRRGKVPAGYDD